MKKRILYILFIAFSLGLFAFQPAVHAKEKASISDKKITMRVGDSHLLVFRNGENNLVQWQITSGQKNITTDCYVSYGELVIKAKRRGTAKIKAVMAGKTYYCKIKIKKASGARNIILTAKDLKKVKIKKSGTVKVPSTFRYKKKKYRITAIGGDCFGNQKKITKLVLPSTVKKIGNGAFHHCSGLKNITLPKGLTDMSNGIFFQCTSLESVTLPASVKAIGQNVFDSCTNLKTVVMSNQIKNLSRSTFNHCKSLTSVTLPKALTYIDKRTFFECDSLATLIIPDSVTAINPLAFRSTDENFVDGRTVFTYRGTQYTTSETLIQAVNQN